MKMMRPLICLLVCSIFCLSCCAHTSNSRSGPLDFANLPTLRTALVIRTDYVYPQDRSWENLFLAQMAGPGDRLAFMKEFLDPLYQLHGEEFYRQLAHKTLLWCVIGYSRADR